MRKTIKLEENGRIVENKILKVLKEAPNYLKLLVDDGTGPRVIEITPECTGHKVRRIAGNIINCSIPAIVLVGGGLLFIVGGIKLIKEIWEN